MRTIRKNIGSILKMYRTDAGYTQEDMAKLTGLSKNHLSAVERGKYKLNMITALTYIDACHIPVAEFFERSDLDV